MAETSILKPDDRKKGFLSIILIAILLLAFYSLSSVVTKYLFSIASTTYDRSIEGGTKGEEDYELVQIQFDLEDYLNVLLDSDYFDDLASQLDMDPEQFMDLFGDDLESLMENFAGDQFDPNLFGDLPPELLAVVLAKTMFYVQELNTNPWDNPEDTKFKITSFDQYSTEDFQWTVSSGMDNLGNLAFDTGSSTEKKWNIYYPITAAPSVVTPLPSVNPAPRIMDYSLSSTPEPDSAELKRQVYMGGASADLSYTTSTDSINLTYTLLYDESDEIDTDYYDANAVDIDTYAGSNPAVASCLYGPWTGTSYMSWDDYYNDPNNNDFQSVADELLNFGYWQNSTNAYDQMMAISRYVGANFVMNEQSESRPADGEDPIEWFCERGESNAPYEFSALMVALARLNGLPARYVSGYKWSDDYAAYLGGATYDPLGDIYPFRMLNMYTWVEAFIPTSASEGEWLEFDNIITTEYTLPNITESEDSCYNIKINDEFTPDTAGFDRFDGPDPNLLDVEVNITLEGNSQAGFPVEVLDMSYSNVSVGGPYLTGQDGIASGTLDISGWVTGPHILNFTTTIGNQSLSNVTIVDVLGAVNVVMNPINPPKLNNSVDPTLSFDLSGYVWDPVIDQPVQYAELVLYTILESETYPDDRVYHTGAYTTNSTGNFTLSSDFLGYDQGNYSLYTSFEGSFDISADVDMVHMQYQGYLPSIYYFSHSAYTTEDFRNIEVIDDFYIETTFFVDGTTYGNYAAQGSHPSIVDRTMDTLYFTATTWRGLDWTTGSIEVYDETEDRSVVNFTTTAGTGYGETYYNMWNDNMADWTAGPHLLRMEWTNSPAPLDPASSTKIWIFVQADVYVELSTQSYTAGSGGSGEYFIDVNNLGDEFDIAGYIRDSNTWETLTDTRAYYTVRDQFNIAQSSYLNLNPNLNQMTNSTGGFSETLKFVETTPLQSGIRSNAYFNGEWEDLQDSESNSWGWDNNWNMYWAGYYSGTGSTSLGTINLADPTDSNFEAWIEDTTFAASYNTGNLEIKGPGQPMNITCRFTYGGLYQEGAWVTLTDVTTSTVVGYTHTNSNGNASFIISYGSSDKPGLHKYRFDLTFNSTLAGVAPPGFNITKTGSAWAVYSNTLGFNSVVRSDGYTNNLTRGVSGDTITVTGQLADTNNQGHLHVSTLTLWVRYLGSDYHASDYLTITTNTYNPATRAFTVTFAAKSGINIGNYSIIIGFTGGLVLSGALNSSPGVIYSASVLAVNATMIPFTVYDTPICSTSYTQSFPGSFIIGGTQLNISGTLTYSDYNPLASQDVVIRIYDENGQVGPDILRTTSALGGFLVENYLVEADILYYRVYYSGSDGVYTNSLASGYVQEVF